MGIQEIKDKLQEVFGDYKFVSDGHYYLYDGKRVGISTTGLIHQYSNEFDSETMSQQVANKRAISQHEVLEEWRIENLHSTIKGSLVHEYAQSLWENKQYDFDYSKIPKEIDLNRLKCDVEKLKIQADNFYNDYKDRLTLIGCELYLGDEDFDECGATDIIFYNNLTGGVEVMDFKTNKKIEKENPYKKFMKVPLQDLPDNNYNHYSLQLCNYAYKITKNTGIEITEKLIVYFGTQNDNYEIIEPLKLTKEIKKILEIRRVKNMNSAAVLVMGASGTGKSTSFRNLPADETAIINVTNKPMPFKNNGIKVVSTTDYASIIKAIETTKKRIIVIDDSSYLMSFENFEKANNKGYDKFTTMALNYYKLIEAVRNCADEKIVYLVTHEENDDVTGLARPKTIGKMLSNQLVIEGLFSIVLRSLFKNNDYVFQTQNDGTSVCKSPIDMFSSKEIPNDLAEVDKLVREYYGFSPINKPIKKKDEENK